MGGRAAASPGGGPLGPLGTPLGVDTPPMVVVVGVLRAPLGPGPPRGGRPIMGGRAAASPGGRPAGCGGGCFEAAPWRVGGGPLGTALGIGGPLGPGARGGAPSGGPAAPRGGSPRGPPVGGSGDRLSPPGICSAGGLPGGGGGGVGWPFVAETAPLSLLHADAFFGAGFNSVVASSNVGRGETGAAVESIGSFAGSNLFGDVERAAADLTELIIGEFLEDSTPGTELSKALAGSG